MRADSAVRTSAAEESRHGLQVLAVAGYPSPQRPQHQVFVHAMLKQLGVLGCGIDVVAPESRWHVVKQESGWALAPRHADWDSIPVHRPRFTSFSTRSLPFGISTRTLSDRRYARAALRTALHLDAPPDICYAHFLYPHGKAARQIAQLRDIPALLSLGESSFGRYENAYTRAEIGSELRAFDGIVANSPQIQEYCVSRFGLHQDQILVLPNGVDNTLFRPRDRALSRNLLGLPAKVPLVAFAGKFIARKGPDRVLAAIACRPEIGGVFLGSGPLLPVGPQVLYAAPVRHDEVPLWLAAADIFVLPTLQEGCCNAILEAMACGLPIVTTDLPCNRELLDAHTAILVPPSNDRALQEAILELLDDPARRHRMRLAAMQRASRFRLESRARRILRIMQNLVMKGALQ